MSKYPPYPSGLHDAAAGDRQAARRRSPSTRRRALCLTLALGLLGVAAAAQAQVNGLAQRPYLGWSSFSQQTLEPGFLTQANMERQTDALRASGLQAHGFDHINLDSGWQGGFDSTAGRRPT